MTLLLADVVGSTRLWESGPWWRRRWLPWIVCSATWCRLITAMCPVEQGEGDSFVIALAHAAGRGGVRCPTAGTAHAIAAAGRGRTPALRKPAMIQPTWGPRSTIAVRDLGHGGQVLLSGATRDLVEQVFARSGLDCTSSHFPLRG